MSEQNIAALMEKLPQGFVPSAAVGFNAVVQFRISGVENGEWVVTIHDGACSAAPGKAERPALTVGISAADFESMAQGKTNAMNLYMSGRIMVGGDMMMAERMAYMFKMFA